MTPRSFGEWCGCTAAAVLVLTAVLFASFWMDRIYIRFHARISTTDLEERVSRLEQRIDAMPVIATDAEALRGLPWKSSTTLEVKPTLRPFPSITSSDGYVLIGTAAIPLGFYNGAYIQ